tara:strand:+ start:435 stop:800 length:366 start_codon:yes stop_codon:yes gene_type:complete
MGKYEGTRYGVQSNLAPGGRSIICTDGHLHYERFVDPSRWTPKLWKTRAGAQRAADRYNESFYQYSGKTMGCTVYVAWVNVVGAEREKRNFSKLEEALGKALDHLAQNDAKKGLKRVDKEI